jgi:hypothetical protein
MTIRCLFGHRTQYRIVGDDWQIACTQDEGRRFEVVIGSVPHPLRHGAGVNLERQR